MAVLSDRSCTIRDGRRPLGGGQGTPQRQESQAGTWNSAREKWKFVEGHLKYLWKQVGRTSSIIGAE